MAPKAPKRQSKLDIPPPAPSSDDEDYLSEDLSDKEEQDNRFEEEEEDEEDEGNQITPSTTTNPDPTPTTNSVSASESGSDSDADSDFTIKPIASKHSKNPTPPPKPSTAGKRAAEAEASGGSTKDKKKKKDAPNGSGHKTEAEKKIGSQRVWSYDDEIKILKGMIEFRSKKGTDPYADIGGFYESVKSSLQCKASKAQLIDKIKRLKKKYQISVAKVSNGEDPVFSNPQEHKLFDLAKKIWGPGDNHSTGVVENGAKSSKKQKKSAVEEVKNESNNKVKKKGTVEARGDSSGDQMEEDNERCCGPEDFWAQHPCLKASIDTGMFAPKLSAEKWMTICGKEKAKHLEQEWKSLQKAELDQLSKKLDLMSEVIGGIVHSGNLP